MASISTILSRSAVFGSLDPGKLQKLAPLFEKRDVYTGELLTTAGEPAQYYFLLDSGTLMLAMDQGRALVLETPGDFAAMDLVAAEPYYRSTTTVLEPGRVYAVSREAFCDLAEKESAFFQDFSTAWHTFYKGCAGFLT